MRTIRLLMADRGLGRAIAALLTYFVVLQALSGSVANASMADAGPDAVLLCSGNSLPVSDDRTEDRHQSCCTVPCRLACFGAGALVPSASWLGSPGGQIGSRVVTAPAPRAIPRLSRLIPEARAPPRFAAPA